MSSTVLLPLLLASLPGLVTASPTPNIPPFFPLRYSYGGYPKIMADISFGTPKQSPSIPTVVDLGSANYWVYGPHAIANYGGRGPFAQGPCNITVKPTYDNTASSTATKVVYKDNYGFSYGNGGKAINAYGFVNDTLCFGDAVPCLKSQQVALSNFSTSNQAATSDCSNAKTVDYDKSILGISRFNNPTYPTGGPSFRQNLLDGKKIETASMSMWFDKHDGPANDTIHGTVLFGAIPKNKYAGQLTRVPLSPPKSQYVGYYLATPEITTTGVNGKTVKQPTSKDTTECLIDSGFGTDNYPISQEVFLNTTGLILHGGYPAYDGPCNSIPHSAAINFTFAAVEKTKTVTISVPLRNYARGNSDYLGDPNKCSLSMDLSLYNSCYLGSPFTTALFLAVNDDKDQIAIAQGGVSAGATKGVEGLGSYKRIAKGDSLPFEA